MIMAARSTVTGTGPAASLASTSRREERCSLSPGPVSPRPPRYTMRVTPACAAASAKRAAMARSASA